MLSLSKYLGETCSSLHYKKTLWSSCSLKCKIRHSFPKPPRQKFFEFSPPLQLSEWNFG